MSVWRAEEWGHLKCHGQGQDRESDFPLGSEVTIPEFNPTQKEGELEWGEGQRKLLRTDSTNLALWTGSLKYAMRYALAFLIYWSWPPMEITLLNVGLRKNLATLKGFWICDDENELKIKHLRWGFGDSAYLSCITQHPGLVLNSQYKCFAGHMPSIHAMQCEGALSATPQLRRYCSKLRLSLFFVLCIQSFFSLQKHNGLIPGNKYLLFS